MMGLAKMALRLAEDRACKKYPAQNLEGFTDLGCEPTERDDIGAEELHPISREYYRIIDRIARGETP